MLGRSGGTLAALPMPLGSESARGVAGPNGTPDIDELPAPAEPAGGVNCANALAGAIRASAPKRTSAGLREIGVSPELPMQRSCGGQVPLLPRHFQVACFHMSGIFCRPHCYGVGGGERIRPNCGAIT